MQIYIKYLSNMARNLPWVLLLVFLIGTSLPTQVSAQSTQPQETMVVSGVVTTEDGETLPGVTIYCKAIANGVITDANGLFSLTVPVGSTIAVTYISYSPVELTATVGANFNVVLQSTSNQLKEVVAVAYGAQKKSTLTGAVGSISTKELKQSSSANLSVALAGRLPGLTTIQSSGQPGRDAVSMFVRGLATTNDQSPLILIDGVPRTNIAILDPNEIESVSILKDASATAVFGVRGANGVILITTRRGAIGKAELSVSLDQSWQAFTSKTDRIHSWEFAELRNETMRNKGLYGDALPYTPYMIEKYKDGSDRTFYPDRDTFEDMFNKWAPQSRLNVNLNGGSDRLQYFMNVGYINQGGNFKTEPKSKLGYDPSFKLDRYTFRANLDYKIAKNLKAFLNIGSYLEKMNTPAIVAHSGYDHLANDLVHLSWKVNSTEPGPVTVGGYGVPAGEPVVNNGGAWGWINQSGYRVETRTNLNSSLGFQWDLSFITPGLTTKAITSFDNSASSTLQGQRSYNEYLYEVAKTPDGVSRYLSKKDNQEDALSMWKGYGSEYYINLQYFINYDRTFDKKHDVSGMVLVQRDNWEKVVADVPYNMVGLSSRLRYAYDSRFLAEFNMGYNGTEQFNPEKRFGFFPAFSAGWNVSNEKFLKNNKILTNLKLRLSYGKVGNDKMGDHRFLYLDDIKVVGGWLPSLGRGQQISQGLIGNPNVTWETSWKQNYGVDIQLIKDLTLTADFFFENREDILIERGTVPSIIGIDQSKLPKMNIGKVDNQGYEFELTYTKSINNDLLVTVKGNYAYSKNTQKFMDEAILSSEYAYRFKKTGYSIGQQFGYIRDFRNGGNGYINTLEELAAMPISEIGPFSLGGFKYTDVNGDGRISEKDIAPIGYSEVPRVTYGASAMASYKGFDLSILFQGIAKTSKQYTGSGVYETAGDGYYSGYHRSAWTPERYDNGETILYPALSDSENTNHLKNDFFVMDRSFLRLKNLEIGYTLPQTTLKSIGVNRLRVYVSGQNLFTWHNLRMNAIDPEQSNALSYPITKTISAGLNVVF